MLTCDYMKIRRAAGNRTEVLQLILQATLDILEEDSFPDDGDSEQEDLTESTYAKNKKNESWKSLKAENHSNPTRGKMLLLQWIQEKGDL